jgi:hypothetical protein
MPSSDVPQPQELTQLAEKIFGSLSKAENKLLFAAFNGETAYCGPSGADDHPGNDPTNSENWGQNAVSALH